MSKEGENLKRIYAEFDNYLKNNDEVTVEAFRGFLKYAYREGVMAK
jgi:hypothetical protein